MVAGRDDQEGHDGDVERPAASATARSGSRTRSRSRPRSPRPRAARGSDCERVLRRGHAVRPAAAERVHPGDRVVDAEPGHQPRRSGRPGPEDGEGDQRDDQQRRPYPHVDLVPEEVDPQQGPDRHDEVHQVVVEVAEDDARRGRARPTSGSPTARCRCRRLCSNRRIDRPLCTGGAAGCPVGDPGVDPVGAADQDQLDPPGRAAWSGCCRRRPSAGVRSVTGPAPGAGTACARCSVALASPTTQ